MRTVASIDIGTEKIVALVGEIDTYGDIHIVGIGEAKSRGVDRGSITRLERAARAIASAVREAEEMSGQKVNHVIINISSPKLKSQNEKDTINISSSPTEIEEDHINRLIERSTAKGKEDGFEIIHTIPRKYVLDDQEGIEDPVGLLGSKLTAQVHLIKVKTAVVRNLEKAVSYAGYQPILQVVNALASAKAVLRDEEKDDGVLLIDIGAGLTDFVLFSEGYPVMTGCIAMGGNSITKDISIFMKVDNEEAERIKKENGVALVDLVKGGDILRIKPRGEGREVTIEKRQLAEVIQIRLEEIMEKIVKEIEDAGFKLDTANAGIVVTGGTANLKGIREFMERFTDLPARIGKPTELGGLKERLEDPKYATGVGLLRFGTRPEGLPSEQRTSVTNNTGGVKGFMKKIIDFIKELL